MDNHDSAYRLLFSHAEMVRDLLLGFVPEPWVAELDLDSLERVNGNYVSDDLRNRSDDVVWRVRWRDHWLYVYLLLEFQSTDERYMAVRLLTYIGLLWQDLIRAGELDEGGLLPPICPIVLYNGEPCWRSPVSLAALYPPLPEGLGRWLPALEYLLIDEGRYDDATLRPLRNLVAALFRLENSRSPAEAGEVLRSLVEWLQSPEQDGLRRNLTAWLKRVLLPRRLPAAALPEMHDLQEVQSMLSERVKSWTAEWLEQGREQGRREIQSKFESWSAEWLEQGREQGLERGRLEGRQLGEYALLQRQLIRRFGPLPAPLLTRLRNAPSEQLEEWGERLLDAHSLEELFGDHPHN